MKPISKSPQNPDFKGFFGQNTLRNRLFQMIENVNFTDKKQFQPTESN